MKKCFLPSCNNPVIPLKKNSNKRFCRIAHCKLYAQIERKILDDTPLIEKQYTDKEYMKNYLDIKKTLKKGDKIDRKNRHNRKKE